jgi:hypothetical protein
MAFSYDALIIATEFDLVPSLNQVYMSYFGLANRDARLKQLALFVLNQEKLLDLFLKLRHFNLKLVVTFEHALNRCKNTFAKTLNINGLLVDGLRVEMDFE